MPVGDLPGTRGGGRVPHLEVMVYPPDQQTVLVTGATDGVGRAAATRLAQLGARVLLHGRDQDRLDETVAEIRRRTGARSLETVRADLSSLAAVDALADEVTRRTDRLHLLLSNAGVGFGPPDGDREVSDDGYELRFAVNHLASHHLARRLVPLLRAGAPSRIVQVASSGQEALDPDDLLTERDWNGVCAYRRSKLAQVMSVLDLADELRGEGVVVHALHPATLMDTTMVREADEEPRSTLEEGLTATVRAVLDPTLDDATGLFLDGPYATTASLHDQVVDAEVRELLRDRTAELIGAALDRG